jgi:hypothetical protein
MESWGAPSLPIPSRPRRIISGAGGASCPYDQTKKARDVRVGPTCNSVRPISRNDSPPDRISGCGLARVRASSSTSISTAWRHWDSLTFIYRRPVRSSVDRQSLDRIGFMSRRAQHSRPLSIGFPLSPTPWWSCGQTVETAARIRPCSRPRSRMASVASGRAMSLRRRSLRGSSYNVVQHGWRSAVWSCGTSPRLQRSARAGHAPVVVGSRPRARAPGYGWIKQRAPDDPRHNIRPRSQLSRAELDLAEVVNAIPNHCGWEDWNRIGMAIFAASGGSSQGGIAFDDFSAKSPKYNPYTTADRWAHYGRSPPSRIRMGTLVHLARQHGWRRQAAS